MSEEWKNGFNPTFVNKGFSGSYTPNEGSPLMHPTSPLPPLKPAVTQPQPQEFSRAPASNPSKIPSQAAVPPQPYYPQSSVPTFYVPIYICPFQGMPQQQPSYGGYPPYGCPSGVFPSPSYSAPLNPPQWPAQPQTPYSEPSENVPSPSSQGETSGAEESKDYENFTGYYQAEAAGAVSPAIPQSPIKSFPEGELVPAPAVVSAAAFQTPAKKADPVVFKTTVPEAPALISEDASAGILEKPTPIPPLPVLEDAAAAEIVQPIPYEEKSEKPVAAFDLLKSFSDKDDTEEDLKGANLTAAPPMRSVPAPVPVSEIVFTPEKKPLGIHLLILLFLLLLVISLCAFYFTGVMDPILKIMGIPSFSGLSSSSSSISSLPLLSL